MTRVAVVGPGAMGCLFGALLAEAGSEVCLIDHRPERAQALAEKGVTVEGIGGRRTVPISATAEPGSAGCFDVLLFTVKAYDTEAAAGACVGLAGRKTAVVTLQNGLGNLEVLVDAFGPERVVAGATGHGATLLGTGHVRHAGVGPTLLAAAQAGAIREPMASEAEPSPLLSVVALFRSAGIETVMADDACSVIWSKVVINAAINPLTALTRLRNGELLGCPDLRKLLTDVATETAKVARLRGANLLYDNAAEEVVRVCQRTAQNRSSMLQDVLAGRPTEIDSLNGAVAQEADAAGTEAPLNAALAALVRGIAFSCHSERSAAK